MTNRVGLSLKILLVAFLNIVLLVAAILIVGRSQFRLDSFLLAPARYRMLSISRLAALELQSLPRERWGDLLTQYSKTYPADFFLFDRDGVEIAGKAVKPPESLFRNFRRWEPPFESTERNRSGRGSNLGPPPGDQPAPGDQPLSNGQAPFGGQPFSGQPPNGPPPDEQQAVNTQRPADSSDRPPHREPREGPPFGLDFQRTANPPMYWAAVHVPLSSGSNRQAHDVRLVWRFSSLWTNSFFFDYKPLVLMFFLVIVVSAICWLPLIRSLTRTISDVTKATGEIANGHFEVKLPIKRRDELGRLSESINQMAVRLASYVEGQRRFLSDVAHELCAPIARIQMSLGILEQRAGDFEQKYVSTIDEEVQHMSALVNDLLSFSKAALGASAVLEKVSVQEAVQRAVDREQIPAVSISIDVPTEIKAMAQPDYLFRSVSNIIRNAIRYAGTDGPIEVTARRSGEYAIISVADQGPGVDPDEIDKIFKPFYRPESARQRETGGVGLGLAIVRSCIEACGGSVACRNRVPKGFEVDLRLPIAEA